MNQNRKIKQIKEENYYTPPVNIEPFVNPFLRLSDNQVLNKLLHNTLPGLEHLMNLLLILFLHLLMVVLGKRIHIVIRREMLL